MYKSIETRLKLLDRKNTRNNSAELMSRPQEMMPFYQTILKITMFPNLTMKSVLVKLKIGIAHVGIVGDSIVNSINK